MFKHFLITLLLLAAASGANAALPVLVSIAPHKGLVEKIGGKEVTVSLLVPAEVSPHSYEPSFKQMCAASKAALWFRSGEGFEERAVVALGTEMEVVDLRNGVHMLPVGNHTCCHSTYDPHIWLSPKELITQARLIATTLERMIPEKALDFATRLRAVEEELVTLDAEIKERVHQQRLFVSHPAFGYFCRDYGLTQLSIEVDGKEPTARHLAHLMSTVRKDPPSTIIVAPQYGTKGAEILAKEIGATLLLLDPYAENVVDTLRTLAFNGCR